MIAEIIDQCPELKNNEKNICSVPGAGKITATILLADLPELGTLDDKKIEPLSVLLHSIVIVVIIVDNDVQKECVNLSEKYCT